MRNQDSDCRQLLEQVGWVTAIYGVIHVYGSIMTTLVSSQLPIGQNKRGLSQQLGNSAISAVIFGAALPVLGVIFDKINHRRHYGKIYRAFDRLLSIGSFLLPVLTMAGSELTGAAIMANAKNQPQDSARQLGVDFARGLLAFTITVVVTCALLRLRAVVADKRDAKRARPAMLQRQAITGMKTTYAYTDDEVQCASTNYIANKLLMADKFTLNRGMRSLPQSARLRVIAFLQPGIDKLPLPSHLMPSDASWMDRLEAFRAKQLHRLHDIHKKQAIADMRAQGASETTTALLTSGDAVSMLLLCNLASDNRKVLLHKTAQRHVMTFLISPELLSELGTKKVNEASLFQLKRLVARASRGAIRFKHLAPLAEYQQLRAWAEDHAQPGSCVMLFQRSYATRRAQAARVALLRTRPASLRAFAAQAEVAIDVAPAVAEAGCGECESASATQAGNAVALLPGEDRDDLTARLLC